MIFLDSPIILPNDQPDLLQQVVLPSSSTANVPTKLPIQTKEAKDHNFVQVVKMHPEILQQMLSTVLNILMFEDCRNQWSMSRPLLGLILLNEDYFQSLRDQVRFSNVAQIQSKCSPNAVQIQSKYS